MRSQRLIFFLLAAALGAAAGLYYGWSIQPGQNKTIAFDNLRSDYRTDLVLMVAEIYAVEEDSGRAQSRLAIFRDMDALRQVQEAILTAGQLGYAASDVDLLANLAGGLQSHTKQDGAP